MPLARGIAASAAYPILLSSVALGNQAPCSAQFEDEAIEEPTAETLARPLKYLALMAQAGATPGPKVVGSRPSKIPTSGNADSARSGT